MLRTSSPQHRQRAGTSPTLATPFCQRRLDHGMCRHPVQEWCCPPPPLDSRERAVSSPLHASWKLLGNISSTLELSPQDIHLCR